MLYSVFGVLKEENLQNWYVTSYSFRFKFSVCISLMKNHLSDLKRVLKYLFLCKYFYAIDFPNIGGPGQLERWDPWENMLATLKISLQRKELQSNTLPRTRITRKHLFRETFSFYCFITYYTGISTLSLVFYNTTYS